MLQGMQRWSLARMSRFPAVLRESPCPSSPGTRLERPADGRQGQHPALLTLSVMEVLSEELYCTQRGRRGRERLLEAESERECKGVKLWLFTQCIKKICWKCKPFYFILNDKEIGYAFILFSCIMQCKWTRLYANFLRTFVEWMNE